MVIFTNGCFDVLHAGHVQMLLYCRYLAGGDAFYVGMDSDARVSLQKGPHRPYYNELERKRMLLRLTRDGLHEQGKLNKLLVDWVDVFDSDEQLFDLIKKYKPDYIVKGEEWRGQKVIGDDLAPVLFLPSFFKNRCSTSEIERRIREKAHENEHPPGSGRKSGRSTIGWRRNR